MQTKRECYVTHRTDNLEIHHVMNGTHQREKADRDGLWVYLNAYVHRYIHDTTEGKKVGYLLKQDAQRAYEKDHSREEFIKRYGKSYL